jgi:Zn-dependent protease with chaperone function
MLKEQVIKDFYGKKNRNWIMRDIGQGRPVYGVLMFTGMCALEFQIFELKFDRNYIRIGAALQALFIALYPMLMQPKTKTLSVLEPGSFNDAIQEVAAAAKFPLKTTYIIDDEHVETVQVFGLPKRKYIAIPKTLLESSAQDEITALTAHAMGSWKHDNVLRMFVVRQVYFTWTWIYVALFCNERTNYEEFGFVNEYPRLAAIAIFTVAFAPFMVFYFRFCGNMGDHTNVYLAGKFEKYLRWELGLMKADKYAMEVGYSTALMKALVGKQTIEGKRDVDAWFTPCYDEVPALSERIKALEKMDQREPVKERLFG